MGPILAGVSDRGARCRRMARAPLQEETNFFGTDILPFRQIPISLFSELEIPGPTRIVPGNISHDASPTILSGIAAEPEERSLRKRVIHEVMQIGTAVLPFVYELRFLDTHVIIVRFTPGEECVGADSTQYEGRECDAVSLVNA